MSATDLEEAETAAWRPKPTEGPVPKRVDRYSFSPLKLPRRPSYARDPEVRQLATHLMREIKQDCREGRLKDPWIRAAAWLNHPYYSWPNRLKMMFPGLGIATGAFIVFIGLEWAGFIPKGHDDETYEH